MEFDQLQFYRFYYEESNGLTSEMPSEIGNIGGLLLINLGKY